MYYNKEKNGGGSVERNIHPVDVIAMHSANGDIRPLRLRMENREHDRVRVDIDEVVSSKEIQYVGVEARVFLCQGSVEGRKCLFELKYSIRSHSWCLMRRVY